MRVLIAEDDKALGSLLRHRLLADGLDVDLATDGEAAIAMFLQAEPDLLILDLDLPLRSGTEVLTVVRELSPLCPVLVVSGRAMAQTRTDCLNMGADDCMVKPFAMHELRARCRAMLRRQQLLRDLLASTQPAFADSAVADLIFGLLTLKRVEHRTAIDGEPVHLTNREFTLLEQLLLAAGKSVSRRSLQAEIWGEKAGGTNALDVHIAALRRKLAAFAGAPGIETLRSSGYRLVLPAFTGNGLGQEWLAIAANRADAYISERQA